MRQESIRSTWLIAAALAFATTLACVSDSDRSGRSQFPEDQPITCAPGKGMALWEAIQPYVAEARETYPEAKARWQLGLPAGQRFFITALFHHSETEVEQVFVLVDQIQDGVVSGRIGSDPIGHEYKVWDSYAFSEQDLLDWTIQHPNGREEGNYVGKFIDQFQGRCPE